MGFGGYLRANTAVDVLIGPFIDDTDGKTAETALTLSQADIKLSKNGQALAQKNDDTAAAADANGYYNCELDTTDTNTEGNLTLIVHESGALPVRIDYQVLAEAAWDSLVVAKDDGFMDVNIKTVGRADTQETEANNLESACANYSATRGLTGTAVPAAAADGAGGIPISDAGGLDLDAKLANTNEITAARMGALTDWIDGQRLDLLLDAIKAMTDKIGTVTNSGGTATIGAILGDFANSALAGRVTDARMAALTDWINGERLDLLLDAVKAKTDSLTFTVAGDVDCNVQTWKGAAAQDMTGDAFARLGAPSGLSVSADIAAIPTNPILDTEDGSSFSAIPWNAAWDAEVQSEVADALNAAIPGSPTAASINDYIVRIKYATCNRWDITEASGDLEIFNDAGGSFATVAAAFATLAGVTKRSKIL